ncbi:MAG: hypothetical protein ACRC8S_18115 [Fimbriiglobus sp.]
MFLNPRKLLLIGFLLCGASARADLKSDLAVLAGAPKEGAGSKAAGDAWDRVVAGGADALLPTLTAFDQSTLTGSNWLRSAAGAIVEAEKKAKRPLPVAAIKAFVQDEKRKPIARRIAFELYKLESATDAADLLATLINDPEADLRRAAIQERLDRAEKKGKAELLAAQKELITFARDDDQVDALAKAIDAQSEKKFNKSEHFNIIGQWDIIGPFDNTDGIGFAKVYPPEEKLELEASYPGKKGDVKWKAMQSSEVIGTIDFNEEIGKVKFALLYASAVVLSEKATPAEIRITSPNAIQIFLNGKKLHARETYHNSRSFDAHVGVGELKAGKNEILIKICQDDSKQPWAQGWEFSGRVCDATGGKIPLQQVLTINGAEKTVPLAQLKDGPAKPKKEKK